MHSLAGTSKAAFRLDFSNFERGFALRCSIGVAVPLFLGVAFHQPQLGIAAALGALSTGFASQQGVYRTRAAAMLATAAGMALSMLVGGYAAHSTIALVAVVAAWGYAYGLISSLGPAATAVGLNSVVALVIADAFSGNSLSAVPMQALFVFAGGLEQTLLVVILWPARRYSAERHALGDAYRELGHFAFGIATESIAAPHPSIIADVRETLADPAPFARRRDVAVFQALVDEAERIRATLAALVTDRYRYERRGEDERVKLLRETGRAAAPLLEAVARALHEARAPRIDAAMWTRAERAGAALDALPGAIGKHARTQSETLLGELRSVVRLASAPAREQPALPAVPRRALFPPLARTWLSLRANAAFDSPFGRHAARLGFALAVAMLVARLGPVHRGYWIPMTVALVLRPDFRATFSRGLARIAGTLLGAIVATVIVSSLHPSLRLDAALAIVFAALGYFVFGLNYGVYSLTVTAYVVFLLAMGSVQEHDAVLDRSIATLAGAGIAAIVYLAWPTWESRRARLALAEQLEAYRSYGAAILHAYVDPAARDRQRLRDLQRAAWQARVTAEASVDTMIAEPSRTHTIAPSTALGILAAQQRVGLALLALNAYLDTARQQARPEMLPLIDAFDRAWERCIALLRRRRPVDAMPALRDIYREADRRCAAGADPDAPVILAECDLLIDGLDAIEALLAAPASGGKRPP